MIVVAGNSFDTHADQAQRHPQLLADMATGIAGFLEAMQRQGRADEVLVITTSEFGWRVQENGSGTDHGDGNGNAQFAFWSGPGRSRDRGRSGEAARR